MKSIRSIRLIAVLLALLSTVGCDQTTKHIARTNLNDGGSAFLPGGFLEFTLAENPGAFLSLGASLPAAARNGLFATGVALGLGFLLAYLIGATKLRRLAFMGLVLIWAGGVSNLIDRFVHHGLVTDFMLLRIGPLHTGIFNVADLAIVTGTVLLLACLCFESTRGRAEGAHPSRKAS